MTCCETNINLLLLNTKSQTTLEEAVISNIYDDVDTLFKQGTTIFKFTNCNIMHTNYKTAVYYGLLNNYYGYANIFNLLTQLIQNDTELLNLNTTNPSYVDIVQPLFDTFKFFITLNCVFCACSNNNVNVYDESTFNLDTVSTYFGLNPDDVTTVFTTLLTNLTTLYLSGPYIPDASNVDLETLKTNSETLCTNAGIILGNYMDSSITPFQDLTECANLMEQILDLNAWYTNSFNINLLLLNEQMYETYRYYFNKIHSENAVVIKSAEDNLIELLNIIYNDDNDYIDVNYINVLTNSSILMLTINQKCYDPANILALLIEKGATINSTSNIIVDLLKNKFIKSIIQILGTASLTKTEILTNLSSNLSMYYMLMSSDCLKTTERIQILKLLLAKDIIDYSDPFMALVTESMSHELIKILITESLQDLTGTVTLELVNYCVKHGKYEELDLILEYNNIVDGTILNNTVIEYSKLPIFVLFTSCQKNKDRILDVLIKYDADISSVNLNGQTPLFITCSSGYTKLAQKIYAKEPSTLQIIDNNNDTCLTIAIKNYRIDTIKWIVTIQTDSIINTVDGNKMTPLMVACSMKNTVHRMVQCLLENDEIDVTATNDEKDALYYLIINKKVCELSKIKTLGLLLQKGSIVTSQILIKSVEMDLYGIVVILMNYLINIGEIDVGYDTIEQYVLKNCSCDVKIKTKNVCEPNFYSLVVVYIRDNIHKRRCEYDGVKIDVDQCDDSISVTSECVSTHTTATNTSSCAATPDTESCQSGGASNDLLLISSIATKKKYSKRKC